MVLTETGLAKVFQRVKSFVIAQLNSKASVLHTHTYSEIVDLPNGIAVDSTLDGTSSNAIANSAVSNALDGKSNSGHTHTKSQITDFPTIPSKTSDLTNDLGLITSEIDSMGEGWVRFKCGLQICWGNMNFGSIEASGTRDWVLTFPKSFVNSNYIAVCGNSSTGQNWMYNRFITYSRTTTSVQVAVTNTSSASSANALASLVTIGKWK